MTDLSIIISHLSVRRSDQLIEAFDTLNRAVASGCVPNTLFNDAKDVFNRATDEAVEAFLKTGPKTADHDMSIWWRCAYDADALVSGLHGVPVAIKRASSRDGLAEYRAFLKWLLPVRELLDTAKPLIAKRGDKRLPVAKSKAQIKRDADAMTCQCCGRGIFAKLGTIAHHGYERPGHGWQTGSCLGAKALPFEVSRDQLGDMIKAWRQRRKDMRDNYTRINMDVMPIELKVEDRTQKRDKYGRYPTITIEVTRETCDAMRTTHKQLRDFDTIKMDTLLRLKGNISEITLAINEQQARFDGWKQTHEWTDRKWKAL